MNDRPTPETDAFKLRPCSITDWRDLVTKKFARRLERERDEAISRYEARKAGDKVVIGQLRAEVARLREALQRLAGCDWVITLPDRMDAVRAIAREALAATQP